MKEILATIGGTFVFFFIIIQTSKCDNDKIEKNNNQKNTLGGLTNVMYLL